MLMYTMWGKRVHVHPLSLPQFRVVVQCLPYTCRIASGVFPICCPTKPEYYCIHIILHGMSLLRSLIPFRVSHLPECQLMHELNCTSQIHLASSFVC